MMPWTDQQEEIVKATENTGDAGTFESASRDDAPILVVEDLVKHFVLRPGLLGRRRKSVHAVDGVSLRLRPGETLGLVGESGCGKSTTGRTIARLLEPDSGRIEFAGRDISRMSRRQLRAIRRDMQILFQDPFASLNPQMTVHDIVAEPLRVHGLYGADGPSRVTELLSLTGVKADAASRYPHEFSGGQRQRIGIARSLALDPKLIVLDEPVSALDVSVQAQILKLLKDLQMHLGLTYIFITHDLSVVRNMCDRVAVMYLGKIMEVGETTEVFQGSAHPYTQALISAVPRPYNTGAQSRKRITLTGDVGDSTDPPSGCRFRTRCWKATEHCALEVPDLITRLGIAHQAACHYAEPASVMS